MDRAAGGSVRNILIAAAAHPRRYAETMMELRLWPIAVALLLAGCYFPATVRSTVKARVIDAESSQPIGDVNVLRIVCDVHDFRCDGVQVDRGQTNSDGRIKLKGSRKWGLWLPAPGGMPAPNHQVVIWKKGYAPIAFSQYGTLAEFERRHAHKSFVKDLAEVPHELTQIESGSELYRAVFTNGVIKLKPTGN